MDNFVEVHYFLLLWGRIRTKVKVLDDHVSYVLSSGKCRPLNNLTAVTIYQIWYTVSSRWNKHVTKPVVTKAWDPASLAGSDDFYAGQISNVVSCDATIILQTLRKDLPLQLGRLIQIVKQQPIYAANNALAQHTHNYTMTSLVLCSTALALQRLLTR